MAVPRLTLVLGGARSGKSAYAEALVLAWGGEPTYIATAEAGDDEMRRRIARHRAERDPRWTTVEAPLALCDTLLRATGPGCPVLVDCLTLWLSNLMGAGRDIVAEVDALAALLPRLPARAVLVANEVGLGIVPETPLGREFRDQAGRLSQRVAALADRVVFMAAGLPLVLKESA